jgi:hypothetical protein
VHRWVNGERANRRHTATLAWLINQKRYRDRMRLERDYEGMIGAIASAAMLEELRRER